MQERLPSAPPPEMPPSTATGTGTPYAAPAHLADPRALQTLTTEHWSLLSQRSLAWTETFARASMFLATLSAAVVALALAGSVTRDGFIVFALVILPVVLFIGLTTAVRISQANTDDGVAVLGMNRIRHAYLEMVPDLEPYFITSQYDDMAGVMVTSGAPPQIASRIGQPSFASLLGGLLHGFVTAMGMIMVINCIVGAVYVGIVAGSLGADATGAVIAGIGGALTLLVVQAVWGLRSYRRAAGQIRTRFPTPPDAA